MALCTTTNTVEYCCVANVPTFFNNNFSQLEDDCRLFYDPTCLNCIVEPCEMEIPCCASGETACVTLYAAKIVGCMPYQAETRFNNPAVCNVPSGSRNATVLCLSNACFDNCVKVGPIEEDVQACCDCINDILNDPTQVCSLIKEKDRCCKLFECCDNTEITNPSTDGRCTNRYVKFCGEFEIDCDQLENLCSDCSCNG